MIDVEGRQKIGTAIRAYLDERIEGPEFLATVDEVYVSTEDVTLRQMTAMIGFSWDGVKEGELILDKDGWDYLQRVLLLLESGGEIVENPQKIDKWHWNKVNAAVLLLYAATFLFWGNWWIFAVSYVLVTVCAIAWPSLYSKYRNTEESKGAVRDKVLYPFTKMHDIRKAIQHAAGFKKKRYPRHLATRRKPFTLGDIFSGLMGLSFLAVLAFYAPILIVLLFVCMPFVVLRKAIPTRRREPVTSIEFSGPATPKIQDEFT